MGHKLNFVFHLEIHLFSGFKLCSMLNAPKTQTKKKKERKKKTDQEMKCQTMACTTYFRVESVRQISSSSPRDKGFFVGPPAKINQSPPRRWCAVHAASRRGLADRTCCPASASRRVSMCYAAARSASPALRPDRSCSPPDQQT